MKNHLSKLLVAIVGIIASVLIGADSIFAQSPASKETGLSKRTRVMRSGEEYRAPLPRISGASLAANFETQSSSSQWLFPGEYESHQAMWLLWPTYENKVGFPSTEPMSDMIRAMHGHVRVNLAVQDADEEAAVRSLLTGNGVPVGHVNFFHLEHADLWARDMGPQFTRSLSGRLRIEPNCNRIALTDLIQ